MTFFTAIHDKHGEMVTDLKTISRNYMSTPYFYVDILAIVPWEFFGFRYQQALKFLKLPRLLRLSRIAKFLEHFPHANIFRIVRLLGFVVVVLHWVASVYGIIIQIPSSNWIMDKVGKSIDDAGVYEKYFSCAYGAIIMLFAGDFTPTNEIERSYGIFMSIIGAVIQATIFGNVAMLISNTNANALAWRKKMDDVNEWMRHNSLEPEIRKRVRMYFDFAFHLNRRSCAAQSWLKELPEGMHSDVLMSLNRRMLEQVPLFKETTQEFIREVVRRLQPQIYLPGDYMIRTGEIGREMYFISRGVAEVIIGEEKSDQPMHTVSILRDGSFFGEIALIDETSCRRTASVVAMTFIEASKLMKADFEELLEEFPDDAAKVQKIALARKGRTSVKLLVMNQNKGQGTRGYLHFSFLFVWITPFCESCLSMWLKGS